MSSKTRSRDVVGGFGEAKIDNSAREGDGCLKGGSRAVSPKRR